MLGILLVHTSAAPHVSVGLRIQCVPHISLLQGQWSLGSGTWGVSRSLPGAVGSSQSPPHTSALLGRTWCLWWLQVCAAVWAPCCTHGVPGLCGFQQDENTPWFLHGSCRPSTAPRHMSLALPGSWGNPAAETASLSCCQPKAPQAALLQPPTGAWSTPAVPRGSPGSGGGSSQPLLGSRALP